MSNFQLGSNPRTKEASYFISSFGYYVKMVSDDTFVK